MQNLSETLDLHEKTRPSHPALVSANASLDYAALASRVRHYAAALADAGVAPGELVGIALKDTFDHVAMLFAVMRLGAIIVPLDWRWTASEKSNLVQHFGVATVLVDEVSAALADTTVLTIDDHWRRRAASFTDAPCIVRRPNLPLVLSLSSGTTGRPTGPLASHQQFVARMLNQLATLSFNQHDRYMLATPLYFGGGRAFVLTHLIIGATVIMQPPPYSPTELIAEIARSGTTSTFLVPTIIRRLLALDDATLSPLSALRLLISSGAPLYAFERQQISRRLTAGFYEYYASTEGGGISVLAPEDQRLRPDSVGRAAFMVEVEVVDDNHRSQPAGTPGRIRYRGPGVATGFFRDAEASAESFHDGWFYPGDLGRKDNHGYLYLLGRGKDMIIRGGVNIYPLEIERVLGEMPEVTEVAVFGSPSIEFGEEVVAAVVGSAGVSLDQLYRRCRQHLAPYKVPSKIVLLDQLPKNSAGKTLKSALANRVAGVEVGNGGSAANCNADESG